jgi:hypothetical protein
VVGEGNSRITVCLFKPYLRFYKVFFKTLMQRVVRPQKTVSVNV